MQYENVYIESMGYVIPEEIVTTDWIEDQLMPLYQVLGVPRGFIERLTGIRERRWWEEDRLISDAAAMAANRALEKAGIEKSEVQCLINASVGRDYIEPSTASIVHHKVGLPPTAMNFDVSNACLGFLNGMAIVANMIELGQIDTGLVVSAESVRDGQVRTLNRLLNNPPDKATLRDNLASFTLGSASVAMVLRHKSKARGARAPIEDPQRRLLGGYAYGHTEHNQLCVAQMTWMKTNSTALLREGMRVVGIAWEHFKEKLGWTNDMIDKLFSHQVSEPQRQIGLRTLQMPESKDYPTLHYLGNTASVAAPISMAIAEDDNFVHPGDNVCLFGVGSGVNSLVMGIEW